MKFYKTSGRHYFTDDELALILQKGHPTHIKNENELGLGRPMTPEDKIDYTDAWMTVSVDFPKKKLAIAYAKELVFSGNPNGYAIVEIYTRKPFSKTIKKHTLGELKLVDGEVLIDSLA